MALQVKTKRDVWLYVAFINVSTTLATLLGLLVLYLIGGEAAFTMRSAIIMSLILPTLIATPISYFIGRTSMNLRHSQEEMARLANTDPLTQLPNRRAFFENAHPILAKESEIASLLVIDADHFKELNDTYGHMMGDKALVAIAEILLANFREDDLVCRIGGEEFAVLIPNMQVDVAKGIAERVVKKINANPLTDSTAIIEYSVSCGVADSAQNRDMQSLFKAADDAMYRAKEQGRNRVVYLQEVA